MWRVGAAARPAEFVAAVVEAWRAIEVVTEAEVQARFRSTRAYRDFRGVLWRAARSGARVLAIGCGRGLAGRSSAYAASVAREIFSSAEAGDIDRLDVTPDTLSDDRGPYDIVVSHSLLHFLFEFRPICRLIQQLVAPGGAYVMANEPNARFWSNVACVRQMNEIAASESRSKRLRKFADPARYWARIRRVGRPAPCWSERINDILRERFHLTAALTPKEIVRLIDPCLPDPHPGVCPIGSDGLDWDGLSEGPLSGMRVEQVVTSGYVLRANPDVVPERWRAVDERLASQYPQDGCSFTALWRKAA